MSNNKTLRGKHVKKAGKRAWERLKRRNHSPLRFVKWSDYYRPGWSNFAQRLLPWSVISLLFLPFTTGISHSWYLAKTVDIDSGRGTEILSAWGGSSLLDFALESSVQYDEIVFPWTTRSPSFGLLAYLPALTIINFFYAIFTAWAAHHYWYQNRQNLIRTENRAVFTAACGAVAVSTFLAILYASLYLGRYSESATLQSIGIDTQTKIQVEVDIGPGMYCAFACPLFAFAWTWSLWHQQRKAARTDTAKEKDLEKNAGKGDQA